MNRGAMLQAFHGSRRGSRFAASAVTVWLLVSLFVSLQPCCALFATLLGQPHSRTTLALQKVDHGNQSARRVSGKDKTDCGDGISANADLAKALPAIPGNIPSSHEVVAIAAPALKVFAVVPRLVLPSAYDPSPPPLPLYLRFLHLLN